MLRTLAAVSGEQEKGPARKAAMFSLRLMGLSIVPILVIHSVLDTLQSLEAVQRLTAAYPLAFEAALVPLLLLGTFAASPFLIRGVLGARPLPAGPLRDRLEAYDARTGFRRRELLLWNTHGLMTNAMYLGLGPRLSYVILTDALVDQLDDEAIEAVYAHEAGHGVRRHLLLNVAMVMGFSLLSTVLAFELPAVVYGLGEGWIDPGLLSLLADGMGMLVGIGIFLLFLFVGLGWVSRRFETEADLHAARTLGDPTIFVRALKAVGLHAGIAKKKGGFRHFGIGRRVGSSCARPMSPTSAGRCSVTCGGCDGAWCCSLWWGFWPRGAGPLRTASRHGAGALHEARQGALVDDEDAALRKFRESFEATACS